eukprot:365930-Chlamydomonas_euryale.AAC.3
MHASVRVWSTHLNTDRRFAGVSPSISSALASRKAVRLPNSAPPTLTLSRYRGSSSHSFPPGPATSASAESWLRLTPWPDGTADASTQRAALRTPPGGGSG